MKYFIKEYIKECDCGEIQGLRKIRVGVTSTGLVYGDWYFKKKIRLNARTGTTEFMFITWLPTGDQLDNEIVRGCRKLYKYFSYQVNFEEDGSCSVWLINCRKKNLDDKGIGEYFFNSNPLIAKIKLLKALLKEDK